MGTTSRILRFTLIELVVVLAIMALSVSLAVGVFRGESPSLLLRRTGGEFETFCARLRYRAMEKAEENILYFEPGTGKFSGISATEEKSAKELGEKPEPEKMFAWKLPESFSLGDTGTAETDDFGRVELFRFFPDGSATGFRALEFQYRGNTCRWSISPLTGLLLETEENAEN